MQIPVDMNREAVTTETTVQLTCSHLECLLFVSIHTRNSKYYIQMRKMNSGCYGYQGFYFLSVQDANTGHHCIRILQILSRTVWINSCLTYQGLLSVVFFLEIFRNPLRFHHVQEAPFWQLEPFWKTQLDKVHIFTHTHTTTGWECLSEPSSAAKMDGFSQNSARGNNNNSQKTSYSAASNLAVFSTMLTGVVASRRAAKHHPRIAAAKWHLFLEVTSVGLF